MASSSRRKRIKHPLHLTKLNLENVTNDALDMFVCDHVMNNESGQSTFCCLLYEEPKGFSEHRKKHYPSCFQKCTLCQKSFFRTKDRRLHFLNSHGFTREKYKQELDSLWIKGTKRPRTKPVKVKEFIQRNDVKELMGHGSKESTTDPAEEGDRSGDRNLDEFREPALILLSLSQRSDPAQETATDIASPTHSPTPPHDDDERLTSSVSTQTTKVLYSSDEYDSLQCKLQESNHELLLAKSNLAVALEHSNSLQHQLNEMRVENEAIKDMAKRIEKEQKEKYSHMLCRIQTLEKEKNSLSAEKSTLEKKVSKLCAGVQDKIQQERELVKQKFKTTIKTLVTSLENEKAEVSAVRRAMSERIEDLEARLTDALKNKESYNVENDSDIEIIEEVPAKRPRLDSPSYSNDDGLHELLVNPHAAVKEATRIVQTDLGVSPIPFPKQRHNSSYVSGPQGKQMHFVTDHEKEILRLIMNGYNDPTFEYHGSMSTARPVILDGANIGHRYVFKCTQGLHRYSNEWYKQFFHGILLAVQYFDRVRRESSGILMFPDIIVVLSFRHYFLYDTDSKGERTGFIPNTQPPFRQLVDGKNWRIVRVPAYFDGQWHSSHDDPIMLALATGLGGFLISRDQFHDEKEIWKNWSHVIERRWSYDFNIKDRFQPVTTMGLDQRDRIPHVWFY